VRLTHQEASERVAFAASIIDLATSTVAKQMQKSAGAGEVTGSIALFVNHESRRTICPPVVMPSRNNNAI
jgi:hypothetical protein